MSVDPESEPTTGPEASLEPQADPSDPEDELGDAGSSKGGSGFTNPVTQF